jgi:hypothetical protein
MNPSGTSEHLLIYLRTLARSPRPAEHFDVRRRTATGGMRRRFIPARDTAAAAGLIAAGLSHRRVCRGRPAPRWRPWRQGRNRRFTTIGTPVCTMYDGGSFYCFGCRRGATIYDFATHLWFSGEPASAVRGRRFIDLRERLAAAFFRTPAAEGPSANVDMTTTTRSNDGRTRRRNRQ